MSKAKEKKATEFAEGSSLPPAVKDLITIQETDSDEVRAQKEELKTALYKVLSDGWLEGYDYAATYYKLKIKEIEKSGSKGLKETAQHEADKI